MVGLLMTTMAVAVDLLLVGIALVATDIVAALRRVTITMAAEGDMNLPHLEARVVLLQMIILHLVVRIVRMRMVVPLQVVMPSLTMAAMTVHLGQEALHEPMGPATMTVVHTGRLSFSLYSYVFCPWHPLINSDDLSNPNTRQAAIIRGCDQQRGWIGKT